MDAKEMPTIRIEVKEASRLIEALKDINGNNLPRDGLIVKRVRHNSPDIITEYFVPEEGKYYVHMSGLLEKTDMTKYVEKLRSKI